MRKVVFKGIINGKEFDNVQDYNEAMLKLVNEGATIINASSQTNIVDEPETKEPEKLVNTQKGFDIQAYIPFFKDGDIYYVDRLVSDDDDLNKRILSRVNDILNEYHNNLKDLLNDDELSIEDVFELLNKVKDIRTQIEEDSINNNNLIRDYTNEIQNMTNQINEFKNKLKVLNNAAPVFKLIGDYYNTSFNLLRDYLIS